MAYLDKKSGIDPKLIKKAYGKAQQIKKQKARTLIAWMVTGLNAVVFILILL